MDHKRNVIRTLSDPKLAVRYIIVLSIIAIVSVLSMLLAVGAWIRNLYGVAFMLIIQMIALIILGKKQYSADLINSLTMVSFSEKGIDCSFLGSSIKTFPWKSIRYISAVKNMYGTVLGPVIQEQFREYCVFSTEELEDDTIEIILCASEKNGVAVIPHDKELLKRLQSQYESFYCHARIEVPDLVAENSK